ncbi:MAG: SRPBCC domain-containing protein [Chloroflexi bacterium]|nr:SRPBCC domain-containing protein [Chloroflexota bacterium]
MKLEQQSTIEASRDAIWAILSDIPRAAQMIPGVKDVVALGENRYSGTMQVGIGPMKMNLQGELTAAPDPDNYEWRLEGQAQDRRLGGGLRVIVEAKITEAGTGRSELIVSTDIQFLGKLGTLGQPLIRSKAGDQMRQFSKSLASAATQ